MIGYRMMFCCLPLFLTLVVIVSTAPILDFHLVATQLSEAWGNETLPTTELTTYDDDDSKDSTDEDIQSTTLENSEETSTDFQLATDVPLDIDEILKLTERIFSVNVDELPSTPTTESPEDDE
jgi:hypothetical protein